MGSRIPLQVEDSDQIVPTTSRKVFIAVDENGLRIGETHPNAKLTDAQVDQMREKHETEGWTYDQLAEHFGVPYITVQKICTYARRASTIARWKVLLLHTPISLTNQPEDQP
jgi:nucleoside phosphorylase